MSRTTCLRRWTRLAVAAGCSLASVIACSGGNDGDDPLTPPASTSVQGCEEEAYTPCDILAPACQKAILATVACIRSATSAWLPPVRTVTESQYAGELTAVFEASGDDADAVPLEAALMLFGLASAGEFADASRAASTAESVLAAYSNVNKEVVIVEHSETASSQSEADKTLILAHELVHALQDQEHDLSQFMYRAATYDQSLALRCVTEGEAQVLTSFWRAALWGFTPTADAYHSLYMAPLPDALQQNQGRSPVLAALSYVPYTYGARYVYDVHAEGGMDAVRRLYVEPPDSTLPIVFDGDSERSEGSRLDVVALTGPEGFDLVGQDVLGPWILQQLVRQDSDAVSWASSWADDRFYVFSSDNGVVASAWRLRAPSALAAEALAQRVANVRATRPVSWEIVRPDGDVLILAAQDDATLRAWATTVAEASATVANTAAADPGQNAVSPGGLLRWVRARLPP